MRSLFFLLFTVVAQVSFSQSKIGKQAENVGKDIEKANTVVGKIDEVGKCQIPRGKRIG